MTTSSTPHTNVDSSTCIHPFSWSGSSSRSVLIDQCGYPKSTRSTRRHQLHSAKPLTPPPDMNVIQALPHVEHFRDGHGHRFDDRLCASSLNQAISVPSSALPQIVQHSAASSTSQRRSSPTEPPVKDNNCPSDTEHRSRRASHVSATSSNSQITMSMTSHDEGLHELAAQVSRHGSVFAITS